MSATPFWVQWALWTGGVLGALYAVARGLRWMFRTMRKLNQLLDQCLGSGEGANRRPGIIERLAINEGGIAQTHKDIVLLQSDVLAMRRELMEMERKPHEEHPRA